MNYSMKNKKKKFTNFRPKIRSRHKTHDVLRKILPLFPFKSVIRFGSTSNVADSITNGGKRVELNTVEGIKNSSNKLLMKACFEKAEVKTANWWTFYKLDDNKLPLFNYQGADEEVNIVSKHDELLYPIVIKHPLGSRGTGNYKIDTPEQLLEWCKNRDISKYLIEQFKAYKLEYRFHTNKNGCFYVCRKALKEDTPKEKRWSMNNETCVWYKDDNEKFFRPNSYNDIEQECIKALKSLKLDFCAFDVRVQSDTDKNGEKRDYQDFFIVEGNSAPSLKEEGIKHYVKQIPIILNEIYNSYK